MQLPENPFVICVDTNNKETGVTLKEIAHKEGILHRAFSIFLLRSTADGTIETLIQQRNPNKYHSGGLWSNSCCSHPQPYKLIPEELAQRLAFELGIQHATIKFHSAGSCIYRSVYPNGMIEHEFDEVYFAWYDRQAEQIQFNPAEVHAIRWIPVITLCEDLKKNPENYTSWLAYALEKLIIELQATNMGV